MAGQNTPPNTDNLFLYDRFSGQMRLINHLPGQPTTAGGLGLGLGTVAQISADGNWVAYQSAASDLVPGQIDSNGASDVFLWNRASDTTTLVSHSAGSPLQAGDASSALGIPTAFAGIVRVISGDGRFVALITNASDLFSTHDGEGHTDVALYSRLTDSITLASHVAATDTPGNSTSFAPSLSRDGRWLAFTTTATNLLPSITDANQAADDVYLWDRLAGIGGDLRLISRKGGDATTTASGSSHSPVVSADGAAVAFVSDATDIEGVSTDTNGGLDVLRYDRPSNTVKLVSHQAGIGNQTVTGDGDVTPTVSISSDGTRVAFHGRASNHVAGQLDTNGVEDCFLWVDGAMISPISLVSHAPGEPQTTANARCTAAIVTPSGRTVVFESDATDLVPGQVDAPTPTLDVFSFDHPSRVVTLVSHVPANPAQAGVFASQLRSLAAEGELVGFTSFAGDLVPNDPILGQDAFYLHAPLFADGFESGDESAWSDTGP